VEPCHQSLAHAAASMRARHLGLGSSRPTAVLYNEESPETKRKAIFNPRTELDRASSLSSTLALRSAIDLTVSHPAEQIDPLHLGA
jgi:hypothetical protein